MTVFLDVAQQFLKCMKDIALTVKLDLKEDSKGARKIAAGEIVEILEPEHRDAEMVRRRVRTLLDGQSGYVTIRGNAGSLFFQPCPKPFYQCRDGVPITSDVAKNSAEIRRSQSGEIFEIVQGPVRLQGVELPRLQCRTCSDNTKGWLNKTDLEGNCFLEAAKVLVCKQSIALTPAFDLGEGKPIRKLEMGEAIEAKGELQQDETRGMSRMEVITKSDGKTGWVTVKGNRGASFIQESNKHLVVKAAVALERRFESGSTLCRMLQPGEIVEVFGDAKVERCDNVERLKGRSLTSGDEGWFTGPNAVVVPWRPNK